MYRVASGQICYCVSQYKTTKLGVACFQLTSAIVVLSLRTRRSARKLFLWKSGVSTLQKLRDATTLDDVARLLGFVPSGLSFVLYKIPNENKYTEFEIPKRGGGKRLIRAPQPRLALLQRRLADILYDCLDELKDGSPPLRRSLAHGFEKKRSIITNASLHKRRRYVLNLDLEDFFPSINFGRVRGFFLKDKHFALQPKVATILAQIACHNNELPQGSPCSPVVSNLVGHLLDTRLARFARMHKCTYSRYADDITFSTSRKNFPPELASLVPGTKYEWQLGAELRGKIEHSGFKINDKKTRMQFRGSRQVTTGLMVNEKVNIRPEYWRVARQMCQALFTTGSYYRMVPATLMGGGRDDPAVKNELKSLNPLEGILSHIFQVKDHADLREAKVKREEPAAARELYRRFLFYKNFVALDRPIILPEGKTDSIYLRCALRKLTAYHPRLGTFAGGKFESKIRLINYSARIHEILELGHGADQLKTFVEKYKKTVSSFGHAPLAFPVIVLVDNDDGGRKIFGLAKAKSGVDISFRTTDLFYHLGANLYLVKTPEKDAAPYTSFVENFFDREVLATKLEGKEFDPNKEHEELGKYGKAIFASKVIEPNANKIDFSGFAPLFDRFVAVLDHHVGLKAAPLAAAG
jgi:RNA-directed DNA polymerase